MGRLGHSPPALGRKASTDDYFSARGDFLLFAMFGVDAALLIDVLPHSGDSLLFAREDLIRVVARNWPAVIEPFELKGTGAP